MSNGFFKKAFREFSKNFSNSTLPPFLMSGLLRNIVKSVKSRKFLLLRNFAMTSHNCGSIETPLGQMLALVTADNRLEKLEFRDKTDATETPIDDNKLAINTKKHPILQQIQKEMNEYFAGKRRDFSVPLVDVDHPLLAIPYGKTWMYKELAEFMGKPKAFRYAGQVCKTNNVCIIIPCHRVVAKSGVINYGAGPERKIFLLDHESKVIEGKLK